MSVAMELEMCSQRIENLRISGFKTFADATLALDSCNVLIGANGAGKSNLLAFLKLIRALALGELQLYVAKAGGANDVLRRAVPATKSLSAFLDVLTTMGKNRYAFSADRTENDRLLIVAEQIERFDSDGSRRETNLHAKAVHESEFSDPGRRTGETKLFANLRVYHFAEAAATAPASHECDLYDNHELREDGGNLGAFLYVLERKHPKSYRRLVATIRQVFASFAEFSLRPSELNRDRIRLRYRIRGVDGDFGAHQFSDGTLRFILVATLLLQPRELMPSMIAIDEPEIGLHPAAIHVIAGLIKAASQLTQIVVTTQSAAMVDEFEPEDVVVVHRADDGSKFERLATRQLQEWLNDYSLGQIWEKNVLGGSPFE